MPYHVSRQNQYYNRQLVVEVEANGLDYSGADALCEEYRSLGEGKDFDDPRDAVAAAILIRDAWRKDGADVAGISIGTTGGMGFEVEPFDGTDDDLRAVAAERWELLPKCDRCGEKLPENGGYHIHDNPDVGTFCSEKCADHVAHEMFVADHLDEWREKAYKALLDIRMDWLAGMLIRRMNRPMSVAHILKRYRKGRLARVVVNRLTDSEVATYAE